MESRFRGCLLGLACGDAVGTAVEFSAPGSFQPVTDMVGGGPFRMRPGQWTDDTSMALCLAESLLERKGFDARDQMDRYVRWWKEGYLSSTGYCFDIGGTVCDALQRYLSTGDPWSGSTDPHSAGNGSLMRLAPVPMYYVEDLHEVVRLSGESSRTTHGTQEAVDACRLFGVMLALALRGASRDEILFAGHQEWLAKERLAPAIAAIAAGDYRSKAPSQIRGSGYVVRSLEAALWCFLQTDSFEDAVLKATNLGDDADTTSAICGQLAGAFYGAESIPEGWLAKLAMGENIGSLARQLHEQRQQK